ncbi:class I SAM-dependent methyltransferase [Bacillus carboniphilus]|uniref:Class I SAM-dependent methyltransferase n=1 Tax=Bacillus carboniphilus TaxID=86663 RepID=A0ABP3GPD1_9BACI
MTVIVTTCLRPNTVLEDRALQISEQLKLQYIEREKVSIDKLHEKLQASILVVGKNRLEYFPIGYQEPIFFHPSSAMFRVKRLVREEKDPLIEVCKLEKGDSFLDCTLGLCSDSIVAAYHVGEKGHVVGLEVNQILSHIVKTGLKTWDTTYSPLLDALNRIEVINTSFHEYLSNLPDQSFDCVYFDPMFEHTIEESESMRKWERLADYSTIDERVVREACRVAKKRVVLKAHYRSHWFEEFGFTRLPRKSAKFHFGFIEKK